MLNNVKMVLVLLIFRLVQILIDLSMSCWRFKIMLMNWRDKEFRFSLSMVEVENTVQTTPKNYKNYNKNLIKHQELSSALAGLQVQILTNN